MPFVVSMRTLMRDGRFYIEVHQGDELVRRLEAGETQDEAEAMLEDLVKTAVEFGGKPVDPGSV